MTGLLLSVGTAALEGSRVPRSARVSELSLGFKRTQFGPSLVCCRFGGVCADRAQSEASGCACAGLLLLIGAVAVAREGRD